MAVSDYPLGENWIETEGNKIGDKYAAKKFTSVTVVTPQKPVDAMSILQSLTLAEAQKLVAMLETQAVITPTRANELKR